MKIKIKYLSGIIIILIFLCLMYVSLTGFFVNSVPKGNYDGFAKCLTEKGVVLYISKYCPHCKNQKEMFGESVKFLNIIDCADKQQVCVATSIEAVPTWIINGIRYKGEQTLQTLSSLTGCSLSQ
jgi:protein-disulfide isomerase